MTARVKSNAGREGKLGEAARYSMLIEWSDVDQEYVVTFPEWEAAGWSGHTGGKTYQEAAKKGAALLESYIMWRQQDGKPLPKPATFDAHAYQPGDTPESLARENEELLRRIEALDAQASMQGRSA